MADVIRIKKGLDIPLSGEALEEMTVDTTTVHFGIVPDDFPGYKWKLAVRVGDEVKRGTALLVDKDGSPVKILSPVAGKVSEIRRGERRKIETVVVERTSEECETLIPDFSSRERAVESLCLAGLWPFMRQRPYDIIPRTDAVIRDIFVTAFDTAPLAPPVVIPDHYEALEAGLQVLKQLTDGNVYLSEPFGMGLTSKYAKVYEFQGPHPAGNVGTQIAAIRPVNKGEVVVTVDARTVARIGEFARTSDLDFTTLVALTGDRIKRPHMVETVIGASLESLLDSQVDGSRGKVRVISGNVLTGTKENPRDGYLRYPYRQITVISEGDTADEFMGWASLSPEKFSVKRSFLSFLRPQGKTFSFDSRIKGGHRAMILSDEFDKVFPFDIYPEYLVKAILANDIDRMEKLGIYEVAPEDFALAEFIDTSKNPLQQIVRDGLQYMREETE